MRDMNSTGSSNPNIPKSFWRPWSQNRKPTTIRRALCVN
jgi:hypothetical protein